jgi:hypothetical protein
VDDDSRTVTGSGRSLRIAGAELIDVSNQQGVALVGEDVLVLWPKGRMTRREALVHAAWIVAVAQTVDGEFEVIRGAVRGL